MIETFLRPYFQRVFADTVATPLAKRDFSPNLLTFLSGLCGLAMFMALIHDLVFLAVLLLGLSGYLDILDGTLARVKNAVSPLGSVLDITMDRFVEALAVLGLFCVDPSRGWLCLLMMTSILLCVTSFLVVGIFTPNESEKSFHYSPGLMERAEAFIFFAAMMIWPAQFTPLALLFCVLVFWTTLVRLVQFARQSQ